MSTDSEPAPLRFTEAKRDMLDNFERDYFTRLHERARGNVSEVARLAGMERAHVRGYLERHGIGRPALARLSPKRELGAVAAIVRPREGESVADAVRRITGITCACSRPGGDELTMKARRMACRPSGYESKRPCPCDCHRRKPPPEKEGKPRRLRTTRLALAANGQLVAASGAAQGKDGAT